MLVEIGDELEKAELDAHASDTGFGESVVGSAEETTGLDAEPMTLDGVTEVAPTAALDEDPAADDGVLAPLPGVTRTPTAIVLTPLLDMVPLWYFR